MKSVLVYRSSYLAVSETFISDHLRGLETYRPIVAYEREMDAAHKIDLVPHKIWSGRIGRKLYELFGYSPALKKLIQRERPALVHAHFLTDAARLVPFIERHRLPLIVTAHGYDATTYDEHLSTYPEGRLLLKRADRVAKAADLIVCVSDFIRDVLIQRGYPAEKLVTVPLGIDLDLITARTPCQLGSGIVTVGRHVEKKGTRYLIEAYGRLPAAIREVHKLTLIGDGPLRAELEALARSLDIEVVFTGGLSRDETLKRVSEARAFCLPSIRAESGDAEGMPIAVMEALALGAPTVVFSGQHMADRLTASDACAVVEARDAEALASRLRTIMTDDAVAAHYAAAGRRFCEDEFSLHKNIAKLTSHYDLVSRQ